MLAVTWISGPSRPKIRMGSASIREEKLGDRGRRVGGFARFGENHELVPAHTPTISLSEARQTTDRRQLAGLRLPLRAQTVVDILEIVEIDEEDGKLLVTIDASTRASDPLARG